MSASTDLAPVAVSVIIPVGSVDAALDRQVDAVVHQAGVNRFEVILAMNAATPVNDEDALRRWSCPQHVQLRVVPAPDRRGAAYARNVGARAARGDLLAFCDADDIVEPGWLHALTEALGHGDAVTGCVIDVFPDTRTAAWHPPATPGTLPSFLGSEYLLSGNLGVHRNPFEVVGGFDESLTRCEDIAFGWALTGAGFSIGYAPDARLQYFHRKGFVAMLRQHYQYGRGMSEVLSRYGAIEHGDDGSSNPLHRLRPNGQAVARRTFGGTARRGALAVGRIRGLIGAPPPRAPAPALVR